MSGISQGDYYINLAREDYYIEGGEPQGEWYGSARVSLGVPQNVQKSDLQTLLNGYGIDGEKLVQNAGKENRQSGWYLTFSAPKSVSVAWSQSDGEARLAIQNAHSSAVKTALNYLESEAAFTRRGPEKEPVKLQTRD